VLKSNGSRSIRQQAVKSWLFSSTLFFGHGTHLKLIAL